MTGEKKKYDTILVAGEGESSCKVYHRHKALLEINGKRIINYVVEALQQADSVGRIFIVGREEQLRKVLEEGEIDLEYPKPIHVIPQRANLYENIWHTFFETLPEKVSPEEVGDTPYRDKAVLIVPCDAPLITAHEVEHFIRHAGMENHDHVLGLTAEESLRHFYPRDGRPGIKMAYLHLREKSYRLNNLHLVKPVRIENRHYIQKMYQYRYQRNFKNLILFGLSLFGKDKARHYRYYIGLQMGLLFGGLGWNAPLNYFRTWTPKRALEESISRIMKTRFVALEVPFPGAALDIDNDRDYEAMKARFDEWREYLSHPENSLLSFSN